MLICVTTYSTKEEGRQMALGQLNFHIKNEFKPLLDTKSNKEDPRPKYKS